MSQFTLNIKWFKKKIYIFVADRGLPPPSPPTPFADMTNRLIGFFLLTPSLRLTLFFKMQSQELYHSSTVDRAFNNNVNAAFWDFGIKGLS